MIYTARLIINTKNDISVFAVYTVKTRSAVVLIEWDCPNFRDSNR